MFQRVIFQEEHQIYREQVARFFEREIVPNNMLWEEQGIVPREMWLKAGEAGLLCPAIKEEYGGAGGDRLHSAIVMEEMSRLGLFGPGFTLHSDIVAPYIQNHGSEELKRKYLPPMATGQMIGAIAMTEPGAGSDLQAMRTTAVRDGEHFVINGQKTFITNGLNADIVVLAAKTDRTLGAKGISLFVVEMDLEGAERGEHLKKLGMRAQDTSELFFNDVRIPAENLLGYEGGGFPVLMQELAWERLQIAIMAVALLEAAFGWTVDYVKSRAVFGKTVMDFQNTRFKLAEAKTEIGIARCFVDNCLAKVMAGELDADVGAMAKYWVSDLQTKWLDEFVQLHGGYGYMWEYPICRAYADTRVHRIYGGTNEIMKDIIARGI